MKITNLKELNKRKTLKLNDKVIFTASGEEIEYNVFSGHLGGRGNDNDYVLRQLNIDKKQIATECYKYTPLNCHDHYWPEFKDYDFKALTRLVKRLYEIIEGYVEPQPITSRFEILDL